jgi:transcriptional regulator with GAF, ATPase, and Fis domain
MRLLEQSHSPRIRELTRQAKAVAPTPTAVLVLGETGVGKEQLARVVHRWSDRADGPFVAINCAAVNAGVVESELFGHLKGSFTGADRDRPGRFQMANGGTLFLDEVGELPLDLQAKLLRVLQEGTFEPVGSDRTVRVDCRVIAATNSDLENAVDRGRFREDLYYRLRVFPLHLPPLRERLEDLPLISEVLLNDLARRSGTRPRRLGQAAIDTLRAYHWPGNLRELGNVLERAMILTRQPVLGPDVLGLGEAAPSPDAGRPVPSAETIVAAAPIATLREAERAHIERALALSGGRIYGAGGAAELLDIKPSTLQSRMKKLGVARREAEQLA